MMLMLRIGIVASTKMSGRVGIHVDWNASCRRNGNKKMSHHALQHLFTHFDEALHRPIRLEDYRRSFAKRER
jgi:hypothetical protein